MSFSDSFDHLDIESILCRIKNYSKEDVEKTLKKTRFQLSDFPLLLSDHAQDHLEYLATRAKQLTEQRFGKAMTLFVPLYLSNLCYNRCTYCGFSMDLDYNRVVLTEDEILKEGQLLHDKGFRHLLLLTGEAPDKAGLDYLIRAVTLLRPLFSSIGIEVQPLSCDDYKQLIQAGVDSLTVYQETYHKPTYADIHLTGKKRNFDFRLDTCDRGGEAGMYRLNIGALLGLYDWKYEAIALAQHLKYLKTHYWQSKLGLSFPRINTFVGDFEVKYPVSDKELVHFITVFRLLFPDLAISLSTREKAECRDQLLHLGVTDMSAESHTEPGGYSGQDNTAQFDISDTRSLDEIRDLLKRQGLDPLRKYWDTSITTPSVL